MTVDMIKESEVAELAREIAEYDMIRLRTVETDADTWTMKVTDTEDSTRDNIRPNALGKLLQATGLFDSWVENDSFYIHIQPDRFLNENDSPRDFRGGR